MNGDISSEMLPLEESKGREKKEYGKQHVCLC